MPVSSGIGKKSPYTGNMVGKERELELTLYGHREFIMADSIPPDPQS